MKTQHYYREKMIGGELYYRLSPQDTWKPVSKQIESAVIKSIEIKKVSPSPAAPEVQNVNDNSVLYY